MRIFFNAIDCYFKEKDINWSNCCGLCSQVFPPVFAVGSPQYNLESMLHPQAKPSIKHLPGELRVLLDEAVKRVNFIKSNTTNLRIFKALCEEMMCLQPTLLLHTEVRWLSLGKVLIQLFEIRHGVQFCLEEHPFQLASKFHDCDWLQTLAYLSDTLLQINNLNLALHNSPTTIFKVSDKIESMI